MTTSTLVKQLRKLDLAVEPYKRGPSGKNPFVISIQDRPDNRAGIFRVWEGTGEIELFPDRNEQQAIIHLDEQARSVTQNVLMRPWGVKPPQQTRMLNLNAQRRFNVFMGPNVRWKYGKMKAEHRKDLYGKFEDRWDVTIPVTCTARARNQSLLVGMDETHLFVSALPQNVTSVTDAHELLRPATARKDGTIRQGEFFFVPVSERLSTALHKKISDVRHRALEPGSSHWGHVVIHGAHRYAIGVITDLRAGRHEPLVLPDWHDVVRNREVVMPRMRQTRSWD